MKKFFSIFLALCMVLALTPAVLASDIIASGYCGAEGNERNVSWTLDSAGTLTISGKGKMCRDTDWFNCPEDKRPKSLVINDGITEIGDGTFDMMWLSSAVIPASVETIGDYAFWDCGFENITIPEGVKTIGQNAFAWCMNLKSVLIPSTVTSIGTEAFGGNGAGCDGSLTDINVAPGNKYYSSIDGVLFNKTQTELVEYPAGASRIGYTVPSGVVSIGTFAFDNCEGLKNVVMPASITNISEYAFCDTMGPLSRNIYFCGAAPAAVAAEDEYDTGSFPAYAVTLYYIQGKAGWTSPTWKGYKTALWKVPASPSATVKKCTNGTVTTTPANTACQTVTVTTAPASGCKLDSLTVKGSCGNTVAAKSMGGGQYSFVMPQDAVTITAVFIASSLPFSDVSQNAWYYRNVAYVFPNRLMGGTGGSSFSPQTQLSRAMLVTILYRSEGEPGVSGMKPFGFQDVSDGSWYHDAVTWAYNNNIVMGISDTEFAPAAIVTREQMAAILYRYSQYKNYDTAAAAVLTSYKDCLHISPWALDAMKWANAKGLITGKSNGTLDPRGTATRAEAAAILTRFSTNVAS